MLTVIAWIPRIARFFGMFRGVAGFVGPIWPYVSKYFRGRRMPQGAFAR
ncbi:MAG: hypothetical protein OWT28_12465 [Firmicutes bacterium]|nr:hypothetical protein [Bacillota bacterium]